MRCNACELRVRFVLSSRLLILDIKQINALFFMKGEKQKLRAQLELKSKAANDTHFEVI